MKTQTKGVLLMALSAVFFSIGGIFIKLIPWSPFAINSVRCLLGAAVVFVYMAAIKKKPAVNFATLLGIGTIIGTTVLFNAATKYTTAANAITLEYTSPAFIILFSFLFFRKIPKKADIIACIAVFFGIFWFFLDGLSVGNLFGNTLGLCTGVVASMLYVLKHDPKMDYISAIFLGLLFSGIACFPSLLTETSFSPGIIVCAVILGIFQLGVAYVLFIMGMRDCDPVPAVLAGSLEPILNPVWVALFYGELISPVALPGAIIVLATVTVYNVYSVKRG